MACRAPGISYFALLKDPWRLCCFLIAIGCLVSGVIIKGPPDVTPRLIPVGGVLLLLTVVWPAVTTVELANPTLGRIALSLAARRDRLRVSCDALRRDLETCAAEVWGSPQSSPDFVEFAIEQAVFRWRGSVDDRQLRGFLLCLMIQEAGRKALVSGPPGPPDPPGRSRLSRQMAELSVQQRGMFLLSSREQLSVEVIATMMDRTVEEIRTELARIQDMLADGEPR